MKIIEGGVQFVSNIYNLFVLSFWNACNPRENNGYFPSYKSFDNGIKIMFTK